MCTHMHVCMYVRLCLPTGACVQVVSVVCVSFARVCCACACVFMCMCAYVYIRGVHCVPTRAYVHTRVHIRACMCVHVCLEGEWGGTQAIPLVTMALRAAFSALPHRFGSVQGLRGLGPKKDGGWDIWLLALTAWM